MRKTVAGIFKSVGANSMFALRSENQFNLEPCGPTKSRDVFAPARLEKFA